MGGIRGIVLMQTSGFATLPNVLASLALPFQIPVLMMVSERGTLGEFNYGQSLVARTMRPVLDAVAIEHHTLSRLDEVAFITERTIRQAVRDASASVPDPVAAAHRRKGVLTMRNTPLARADATVCDRFDLTTRLVARLAEEDVVVGGIGYTNFDLWASGQRARNFYMLGSMGLAVPIALGLAIARPELRVVAIEGDGSLLMQLGALATVAERAPANLLIVVMDNGAYQITGGQPTATAAHADLVAVARGCGIGDSDWARDPADFERLVDAVPALGRPSLIGCRITTAKPQGTTERDPARIRDRFMRAVGNPG